METEVKNLILCTKLIRKVLEPLAKIIEKNLNKGVKNIKKLLR